MRGLMKLCVLATALAAGGATANAADDGRATRHSGSDAVARGYTGLLPSCGDAHVHGEVAGAFSQTERLYWGTDLRLTAFIRPREIGYRTWGPSFIPRRFCSAGTYTTDGRLRTVVYSIAERQGFASLGWGVEWCVTGLDRSLAYAPDCKMARP